MITGANRGIGFAILQAMIQRSPADHYLLACRDIGAGVKALEELRGLDLDSSTAISVLELDVTSDESLKSAAEEIRMHHGKLDILINNAGIAVIPKADLSDLRDSYNAVYDTNVTSVAMSMSVFLPLLWLSPSPRTVNISSARGSFGLSANMPPTVSIAYNTSKTALNALTVEYAKAKGNEDVQFHVASPGHCKTAFNGFRGRKDPIEGAKGVVELAFAEKGKYANGIWQMEGEEKEATTVPW